MSISTRVTVGTTATLIAQNTHSISRAEVRLKNSGSAIVNVGGSDVTTANGYEIAIGAIESFNLDAGETLYGVVAAATQVVEVLIL